RRGTAPGRDFRRDAVLAEGKSRLLIGSASYRKRAGIDHPVERTIRAGLDNARSSILQLRIPVFVRECHFRFRYMPVRVPRLNHLRLQTDLVKNSERKSFYFSYHVEVAL